MEDCDPLTIVQVPFVPANLTAAECVALFQCIIDNGTPEQFNQFLSKLDFTQLSQAQCDAIANCIVNNQENITQIVNAIDFCNLTPAQYTCILQGLDFTQLSQTQVENIFQKLIDNSTATQFTELLQKFDMSQLTSTQVNALCAALQSCDFTGTVNFSELTTTQIENLTHAIDFCNLTATQITCLTNAIDFTQLTAEQIEDLNELIDTPKPYKFECYTNNNGEEIVVTTCTDGSTSAFNESTNTEEDITTGIPQDTLGTSIDVTQANGAGNVETWVLVAGVVELKRANNGGLYNSISETSYSGGNSPADTEWTNDSFGPTFTDFEDSYDGSIGQFILNASYQNVQMRVISTGQLFNINFTAWQNGGGGGFSASAQELIKGWEECVVIDKQTKAINCYYENLGFDEINNDFNNQTVDITDIVEWTPTTSGQGLIEIRLFESSFTNSPIPVDLVITNISDNTTQNFSGVHPSIGISTELFFGFADFISGDTYTFEVTPTLAAGQELKWDANSAFPNPQSSFQTSPHTPAMAVFMVGKKIQENVSFDGVKVYCDSNGDEITAPDLLGYIPCDKVLSPDQLQAVKSLKQEGGGTDHADDDVETVTGKEVDNTLPRNPIVKTTVGEDCYSFPINPQNLNGEGGARGAITLPEDFKQTYTATQDILLDRWAGTFTSQGVTVNWETPRASGSTSFGVVNAGQLNVPLSGMLYAGETLEFTYVNDSGTTSIWWNANSTFFNQEVFNGSSWEGRLYFSEVEKTRIRKYTNGTFCTVNKEGNAVDVLAAIPPNYTLIECKPDYVIKETLCYLEDNFSLISDGSGASGGDANIPQVLGQAGQGGRWTVPTDATYTKLEAFGNHFFAGSDGDVVWEITNITTGQVASATTNYVTSAGTVGPVDGQSGAINFEGSVYTKLDAVINVSPGDVVHFIPLSSTANPTWRRSQPLGTDDAADWGWITSGQVNIPSFALYTNNPIPHTVIRYKDINQTAADIVEVDGVQGGTIGATWNVIECNPTIDWIKEECYLESIPTQLNNNGNTRNTGPAFSGLIVSYEVDANPFSPTGGDQANKLTSVTATIDNTGSGSVIVTNTTTGKSSTSSNESWTGAFSSLTSVEFTLDNPLDISEGDLITVATVGSGGRWRFNLTGNQSGIVQGITGIGADGLSGHFDGVFESTYNIRTYEDGSLKQVDKDLNTLTDIESIDPTYTLVDCNPDIDIDWIKEECYEEVAINSLADKGTTQVPISSGTNNLQLNPPFDGTITGFTFNVQNLRTAASTLQITVDGQIEQFTVPGGPLGVIQEVSFAFLNPITVTQGTPLAIDPLNTNFVAFIESDTLGGEIVKTQAPQNPIQARIDGYGGQYTVRTYEDGSLKLVNVVDNTLTDLETIPSSYILTACLSDRYIIKQECLQEVIDESEVTNTVTLPSGVLASNTPLTFPSGAIINLSPIINSGAAAPAVVNAGQGNRLYNFGTDGIQYDLPTGLSEFSITYQESTDAVLFNVEPSSVSQGTVVAVASGWEWTAPNGTVTFTNPPSQITHISQGVGGTSDSVASLAITALGDKHEVWIYSDDYITVDGVEGAPDPSWVACPEEGLNTTQVNEVQSLIDESIIGTLIIPNTAYISTRNFLTSGLAPIVNTVSYKIDFGIRDTALDIESGSVSITVANDEFTVSEAGIYKITFDAEIQATVNPRNIEMRIFAGTAGGSAIGVNRSLIEVDESNGLSITGIVQLAAGDTIFTMVNGASTTFPVRLHSYNVSVNKL